ncbi:MAG: S8 family serine peptidase [Rhodospirillales bacterium]|nr:S8 family serine peptidase [Rhodospirillales bacterium]
MKIQPLKEGDKTTPVAVVDSGVAEDHPQLQGRVAEEVDFTSEGPNDFTGHGTVVSLILLNASDMTAASLMASDKASPVDLPKIVIVNVKVADRNGEIKKQDLIRAIDWIGRNNIRTANLSLGFLGTAEEHQDLCQAIRNQPHVFFFIAAGNQGPDVANYPAACEAPNAMSVGATGPTGKIAPYSGSADIYAPGTIKVISRAMRLLEEGIHLSRLEKYDLALNKLQKAFEAEPLAEAKFEQGLIYLRTNNLPAAREAFQTSLKIFPDFASALEHLGLVFFLENDLTTAKVYIENAISLVPGNPRAHVNLSSVLQNMKQFDAAIKELEEAQRLAPDYPGIAQRIKKIELIQILRKKLDR